MAARDRFHFCVKKALQKEQWIVTDDPLKLEVGGVKFEIDLGAECLIGAEKDNQKIAVEVKSFLEESSVNAYHAALGQFLNYKLALELSDPDRVLYLAVPVAIHESFFDREFLQASVQRHQVRLIVYDPIQEEIVRWIS
jgi:XisH protein